MEGLEDSTGLEEINLEDKPMERIIEPGQGLDEIIPISLPETLYSSMLILPLCQTIGKDDFHRKIMMIALFFCLLANLAIQGCLLGYVYYIYEGNKSDFGTCGDRQTNRNLRVICIGIYTAYCFSDVAETFKMSSFVYNFPSCKCFEKLQLKETIDEAGEPIVTFASGMTKLYKMYCYLMILFPKFGIAVALLTYGTGFVVTTDEDENLILNALALGFVLDIDNMFYEYFMTFQMREVVAQLPPIYLKNSRSLEINTHYGTFIKAAILIGLTLGTLNSYCPNP